MEAELKKNFPDARINLIEGSGGVFDVKCDDKLIYSKKKTKRRKFPEDGEITDLINKEME